MREFPVEERGEINRSKLGWLLKKNANRIVGSFEFQKAEADGRTAWRVVEVKTPPLTPSPPAPAQRAAHAPTPLALAPLPTPQPTPAPVAPPTLAAAVPVNAPVLATAPVAPAPSVVAVPAPSPPAKVDMPTTVADYQTKSPPVYPAMSKRMGEQGRVVLRVLIGADGVPQQAEVQQSSGHGRLDRAAAEAVMRWRYVPGKRGGVPETMWFQVPIEFKLENE
jgi:protein TonB